jgi:hypothetical protein
MTNVIRFPHRQHFSPVIDLDHRAQVVRFPNLRTRAEIAALDEQLAAIRLGVLAAERRAEELELARMLFEDAMGGSVK